MYQPNITVRQCSMWATCSLLTHSRLRKQANSYLGLTPCNRSSQIHYIFLLNCYGLYNPFGTTAWHNSEIRSADFLLWERVPELETDNTLNYIGNFCLKMSKCIFSCHISLNRHVSYLYINKRTHRAGWLSHRNVSREPGKTKNQVACLFVLCYKHRSTRTYMAFQLNRA